MNKACVFGNPIQQSKSPIIHQKFAEQFGIQLSYTKRFAESDAFVSSAESFFSDPETIGANVTMPFKHDAYNWVSSLSPQAKHAGAVNTIIRTSTGFKGETTDGYGLVTDLLAHQIHLQGANILLIGAGGAAKGALSALIDAGISSVTIYNRSIDKAEYLVRHSNIYKADIAKLYSPDMHNFDVVINATSLSLQGQLPQLPTSIFKQKPAVYDMVYLFEPTAFLKWATEYGCSACIDGLGMLVHQAARSFELWFSETPDTTDVSTYLRTLVK